MKRSKQKARKIIQSRLDEVSGSEYQALSATVYGNCRYLLDDLIAAGSSPAAILLYRAYTKWREVPLSKLETDYPDIAFDYAPTSKDAALPHKQYDVVFVPLYGFAPTGGYRLGHGSGWYDRLLAAQPEAFSVGVGIEKSCVDFTVEPHDIPLAVITTEDRRDVIRPVLGL